MRVLRGIRRGARVSALTGRFPASRSAVQAPEIRDGTTTIEGDFEDLEVIPDIAYDKGSGH